MDLYVALRFSRMSHPNFGANAASSSSLLSVALYQMAETPANALGAGYL
jgi:hypothetical protein